jgi:proline iminopeptidase
VRPEELHWYYQDGASWIFPDEWQQFVAPIPPDERSDFIAAYRRRLTGDDLQVQLEAAIAWSRWEGRTITLLPNAAVDAAHVDPHFALAFARIENHYFVHQGFLTPGQLLRDAHKLHAIPGVIIQGRYDLATPARTAWELHQAWPQADFHLVPDAGHAFKEPGILDRLIRATDQFAR